MLKELLKVDKDTLDRFIIILLKLKMWYGMEVMMDVIYDVITNLEPAKIDVLDIVMYYSLNEVLEEILQVESLEVSYITKILGLQCFRPKFQFEHDHFRELGLNPKIESELIERFNQLIRKKIPPEYDLKKKQHI